MTSLRNAPTMIGHKTGEHLAANTSRKAYDENNFKLLIYCLLVSNSPASSLIFPGKFLKVSEDFTTKKLFL